MGKHDKKKEPLNLKELTANGIVALIGRKPPTNYTISHFISCVNHYGAQLFILSCPCSDCNGNRKTLLCSYTLF